MRYETCKDIVLESELVDNIVEQKSDVEIKYDEDDVQETPTLKRKCYEAVEINVKILEETMIEQLRSTKIK